MRPASLPLWIPLILLNGCGDAANGVAQSPDAGRDAGVVRDAGADMGENPDASADADAGGDPRAWTPADVLYVGRFDAALSTVALSGIGVVRNEAGSREEQMLTRYNRVWADEADSTGTIQPVEAARLPG